MYATIEALRCISLQCLSEEPLTPEQSHWLGASLKRFLDRQCPSLEEALDLRFPQGGVPWWREEAIRQRNAALCELANRHFAILSPHAQAQRIGEMTGRYAASAWRHDRRRDGMPAHYRGTPKEFVWRAFASGATMPLGERQLRNILGR